MARQYKIEITNETENDIKGWLHDDGTLEIENIDSGDPFEHVQYGFNFLKQAFDYIKTAKISLIKIHKL